MSQTSELIFKAALSSKEPVRGCCTEPSPEQQISLSRCDPKIQACKAPETHRAFIWVETSPFIPAQTAPGPRAPREHKHPQTNDLYIPLSCPSSENVTKYFFHCFLNFVRPPNPLNFFTCFCKSLFELLCFFLLTVEAFQIFLQANESLKIWSFPKLLDFLENWHFSNIFTNLPVNCSIRTSFCDYIFVCKTQKETGHPSVTHFSIKLEKTVFNKHGRWILHNICLLKFKQHFSKNLKENTLFLKKIYSWELGQRVSETLPALS